MGPGVRVAKEFQRGAAPVANMEGGRYLACGVGGCACCAMHEGSAIPCRRRGDAGARRGDADNHSKLLMSLTRGAPARCAVPAVLTCWRDRRLDLGSITAAETAANTTRAEATASSIHTHQGGLEELTAELLSPPAGSCTRGVSGGRRCEWCLEGNCTLSLNWHSDVTGCTSAVQHNMACPSL